ncbi:putative transcriptional regulatory protein pdtaR [Agrobacterium sp. DSM 25558]|uniref:response regulator n=1 Tax=Agrobacterium sp. DSM 25558 TaxID=1907665 RepID=UPI0009726317|nr:response regulator [Agrobacterium sp. DSM 25558]SCX31586.1 putative transcriptional regulatory protein pdtaR [Agrobacterium sp. DSM 25558]
MRKVLVVDDEALIRMTVIDALEDAGFTVIEAGTADEALDIIEEQAIHFLFTDIQMPGTNSGVDLAHEVATRFPDAGIIVASGRVRSDDIDLPPSAEFLTKPYDLDHIVKRFKSLTTSEPTTTNERR